MLKLRKKIIERLRQFAAIPARLDAIQEAIGRIEAEVHRGRISLGDPRESEFKVYSQWGEDGIINHILDRVPIVDKTFVEFGVETYTEANTLFLLKHRYWRGLVIDGSRENVDSIVGGRVFWKYDLYAECSFINRDNINEIIGRHSIAGDIGLLSVDIDGNDYWIWEAVSIINPRIVVVEYNSLFGPTAKLSVPYDASFERARAHESKMYYGASMAALAHLGQMKGYSLVCGNSAGNNAFFVRNDCMEGLRPLKPEEAYVRQGFREARGPGGAVELLTFAERQLAISHLPVVEVVTGRQVNLRDAL